MGTQTQTRQTTRVASASLGERFAPETLGSRRYRRRKAGRQVGDSIADVCELRLVVRNVTLGR